MTMTDDIISISGLVLGGLTLALTLTQTGHVNGRIDWAARCQRCVGSGTSPTVVAKSLLGCWHIFGTQRPQWALSPISLPHRRPAVAPNPACSTLNKLINQASSARTRERGTAGT